jgi:hypothetical protein
MHIHNYIAIRKLLAYKGKTIKLDNLMYCKECDGLDDESYDRYVKAQEELVAN